MTRAGALGALIAVGLAGTAIALSGPQCNPGWHEIAWPFPRDAWPAGRAFRCDGPGCGGAQDAYVRVKLGFCNCATGVDGDAEVDGVSDLDMISDRFEPRGDGQPITAGGMPGRTRSYTLTRPNGRTDPAAGYALSARCDLVAVATIGADAGTPPARHGVAALLETHDIAAWLRSRLGKG